MKKLLLAVLIFCASCESTPSFSEKEKTIPVKPFYVIGKKQIDVVSSRYLLVDKNGYIFTVDDSDMKYYIGDSIE